MIKTTNVVVVVLLVSTVFSFSFIGYTNEINFAVAQSANSTDSGPETLQDFEKEIGDNNSAISVIQIILFLIRQKLIWKRIVWY